MTNDREQNAPSTDNVDATSNKDSSGRRFLKAAFDVAKQAVSLGSKIFLGFTILNIVVSFFQGTADADVVNIAFNLVIIFSCVAANVIFYKTKLSIWLRYLLAYISVLIVMCTYVLVMHTLFEGGDLVQHLVNTVIFTTVIFVIIDVVDRVGGFIKKGNNSDSDATDKRSAL